MKVDTFANRLRAIMLQTNTNAAQLSKISGVSTSTLSQYLSGKYSAKQERVAQLAEVFGCDPLWLEGYDVAQQKSEAKACFLPVVTEPVRTAAELSLLAEPERELACSTYDDGRHYYLSVSSICGLAALSEGDLALIELCSALGAGQIGVFSTGESGYTIRMYADKMRDDHTCVVGRVVYAIKKWQ